VFIRLIVIERLEFLKRIWKVTGLSLGPETGYLTDVRDFTQPLH